MPAGKTPSSCAARWACMRSCMRPFTSICLSAWTLAFNFDLIVPEFLQKYYLWAGLAGLHHSCARWRPPRSAGRCGAWARIGNGCIATSILARSWWCCIWPWSSRAISSAWAAMCGSRSLAAIVIGALVDRAHSADSTCAVVAEALGARPTPRSASPRSNPSSRRIDVRRFDPRGRR